MVLLGRAIAYSHKLSVQTTVLLTADTASPQFVMQVLAGGMSPQFGDRVVVWGWRWVFGSPVMTSGSLGSP